MDILNKNILIVGASGGIGSCTSKLLAEKGANLILVGRNQKTLSTVLKNISKLSTQKHTMITADLMVKEQRDRVVQQLPNIDILVNISGINQLSLLTNISDEEVEQMIMSNLISPMLLIKKILPQLLIKDESAILNVGSIMGSIGMAGSTTYCASKFGLYGFTESLRRELADSNVEVNYIAPRATDTKINQGVGAQVNNELGNSVDSPEKVAKKIVVTLTQSGNSMISLGWPEKFFVKINSLFPKIVDNALKKQLPIIKKIL